MSVDEDQLIKQMETLADKLDVSEETRPISDMIRGWVLCIQEQMEDEDKASEDYTELKEIIDRAVSDAKGYKPYNP